MSQPASNMNHSSISNGYSAATSISGPIILYSRGSLSPRSSDGAIMHASTLRLSEDSRAHAIPQPVSRRLIVHQIGQESLAEGVAGEFFSTNDRVGSLSPMMGASNEWGREQHEVIQSLQQWARDLSVTTEVRMQRWEVYETIVNWLDSEDFLLTLQWNLLPNIFHTTLMQARLRSLIIECPARTCLGVGVDVLELPELKGNLMRLESLCISGAGITYIGESIGDLKDLTSLWIMYTCVAQLPESIGSLAQLETIKIVENRELTLLPNSIVHLIHLRTLNLDGCVKLSRLPDAHHSRSSRDLSDDASSRFGNLRRLTELSLWKCYTLESLPESLCMLSGLKFLCLSECHALTELPDAIGAIRSLLSLRFSRTRIESIPVSLYRLALTKSKGFLASPWNESTQWMLQALKGTLRPYSIHVARDELYIVVKPETLIPYAQEHLALLVGALEEHGLTKPPRCVFIRHEGEEGIDQGGLTRNFFGRIFPNLALQIKEVHPILVYAEDRGYYILEREKDAPMKLENIQLCKNIGKLLCALTCGLGRKGKIGNVFPQHIYAYLFLNLFVRSGLFKPLIRFREMSAIEQISLCRDMACLDQDGVKDGEGNILFQKKYFNNPLWKMNFDALHKLWILMNHIAEDEDLKSMFPSMLQHGLIFDDYLNKEIENEERFMSAFLRDIVQLDTKQFIDSTLTDYAVERYSRQCEALTDVMHGFKEGLGNRDRLLRVFERCGRGDLQDAAKAFSMIIQGPPFTRASFEGLMSRCVMARSTLPAVHAAMEERMRVIKEEYLTLPHTRESEEQMKRMVRCILGSEVIMPDRNLVLYQPRARNNALEHNALEPKSIFHTCSGAIEIGNELMTQDITTREGKKQLFEIWLNHVTEGLGAGFSLA